MINHRGAYSVRSLMLSPRPPAIMQTTSKDFSIAIVGAGLCGLACAVGLSRAGISVKVFEARSKFDEVGAGVGLGPNAVRALEGLGIFEAVLKRVNEEKASQRLFTFIAGTGDHEEIYNYIESSGEKGKLGLGVYRPAFLEAMMPLLGPNITSFNKRLTSIEIGSSGKYILYLADNTTYEADLVIGADGIKSTSRSAVVSKDSNSLGFSNTHAYRGLVPIDVLKAAGLKKNVKRPLIWAGLGKHIVSFPIESDTVLNVVAFHRPIHDNLLAPERPHPWVETVSQKELLDAYEEWGSDATIILQQIKNPSRWSIHTLYPPLSSFVKGKVVLVGDAAHGMLPHLGAGVGQGFEDVYVLCRLLSLPDTKLANLDDVLAVYDKLRVPRANMVLEKSIEAGNTYDNYGPGRYDAADLRKNLPGMWEPIWDHDLEAQVSAAIQEMREGSSNNV